MEHLPLPERMFAIGEEPVGERVNTYHKPKRIESILDALDPEEIEWMRNTPFGKIISLAENPSFSGSFGQFVIVRQLRTKKKYEIWFLFAGKPLRMSLNEFAHATGLNCRSLPRKNHKRKKNPIKEKLYWGEIFGSLKFCLVDTAIEMLKKRSVKDREVRLKYACLAFVSCVLLPTSHLPRIIPDHVEMIRDMDEFLKYPWGRVSFEMLVTGIKKKDDISISQTSVALPGFVDAIQLVFMAAVPQIREPVHSPEPVVVIDSDSDSESEDNDSESVESEEDVVIPVEPTVVRYYVNPAHVRDLDTECKVDVISEFVDASHTPEDLAWEDEAADDAVDNLRRLVAEGCVFTKSMFVGGLSSVDLARLRAEKKLKDKEAKEKKDRETQPDSPDVEIGEAYDPTHIANLVGRIVNEKIEETFTKVGDCLEERLTNLVKVEFGIMQEAFIARMIEQFAKSLPNTARDEDIRCGTEHQAPDVSVFTPPAPNTHTAGDFGCTRLHPMPSTPVPQVLSSRDSMGQDFLSAEHVDQFINTVVSAVGGNSSPIQVADVSKTTPSLEEGVSEDVLGGHKDHSDVTSGIPPQKTTTTLQHLSPLPEESTPSEDEDDVPPLDGDGTRVPDSIVGDVFGKTRRSQRNRTLPPLFNDYQCDTKIKAFRTDGPHVNTPDNVDEIYMSMRESVGKGKSYTVANGVTITTEELIDVVDRAHQMSPQVMDSLMYYISLDRTRKRSHTSNLAFYDTKFPALLMKHHSRFTKTAVKDRMKLTYDDAVLKFFKPDISSPVFYDRIYFPFYIDKQHWVGICLDISAATVEVLDCNVAFRTDNLMKKDLSPITIIVPHILTLASGNLSSNRPTPFLMSRLTGVPQNPTRTDSGATTVLLIQAHAADDIDGFKQITPENLTAGAKHVAVLVYRDITPV